MGDKIYVAKQDTLLEVQQTVNKTDTTIGNIGDPAGEESLVGLVKNIPKTVPTGAVKSVQRGEMQLTSGARIIEITISDVTPEKCQVSIMLERAAADDTADGVTVAGLTSTSLSIRVPSIGTVKPYLSWEVTEYF